MRRLVGLMILSVAMIGLARAESAADIIELAQKNLGEDVLIAAVENAKARFELSAQEIIKLKEAKVSDKVIVAMLKHRPGNNAAPIAPAQPRPQPKVDAPVAPRAVEAVEKVDGEGTLDLENLDTRLWSYMYEPDVRTIWISEAAADGRGDLEPHGGISLRMKAGTYQVRFNGEARGQAVRVQPNQKSLVMFTRVENDNVEALYATVFEKGERISGGRIATLREAPAEVRAARKTEKRAIKPADDDEDDIAVAPRERVVERERIVEVPSTTVVYRDPYYYTPSVSYVGLGFGSYYSPRYRYSSCYPRYSYSYPRYGYSSGYYGRSSYCSPRYSGSFGYRSYGGSRYYGGFGYRSGGSCRSGGFGIGLGFRF